MGMYYVFLNHTNSEMIDPAVWGPMKFGPIAHNGVVMEILCAMLGGIPRESRYPPGLYEKIQGRWRCGEIEMTTDDDENIYTFIDISKELAPAYEALMRTEGAAK